VRGREFEHVDQLVKLIDEEDSVELKTVKAAYELAGSFEERIYEAISQSRPQDVMYLACELAHAAILAERNRCVEAVNDGFAECGGYTELMEAIIRRIIDPRPGLQ